MKDQEYLLKTLMKNYFDGSIEQLLSFFVEEDKIDEAELDELLEN